ncbi:polysaccharide deacetylase family protein [Cyclobacterium jeungdonense]|uniref:Polysaccharide deacetylase family protein n=1 Tax=Cyclobacterium jeungdonense TaxID=708087 RepID=A0ABT8C5R3_9BACT|nr:polysaccharide deacetylase family protein [Cyclobacterium jeungdonense]MDN3687815.1 polysaccharide deacetylase family protein [Cyclobacterium jeungdonense]
MKKISKISPICMLFLVSISMSAWAQGTPFPWPDGNKMALSLSFDDARASNPLTGIPLLNKHGILATFFVLPEGVKSNLEGWKMAAKQGHEMANHSFTHPCSGNFTWSREKALENYTEDRMEKELLAANQAVYDLLDVKPAVYAYPCGQKYFGSGRHTQSLVPLIAEHFLAGRGWLDEAAADPWYVDMAQLPGIKMDDTNFETLLPMIQQSSENGHWLILAGHETGTEGPQTTRLEFLEKLAVYVNDPANKIWVAPMGTIAQYVKATREAMLDTLNQPRLIRANPDGNLILTAEKGKGIGPDIQYMPEWKAFGWFTEKDQVVWEMEVPETGSYEVWMEWSVSDEEAGKEYLLSVSTQNLQGKIEKTGSWETFRQKKLGILQMDKGYQKLSFKGANPAVKGPLLDIRKISLEPVE